MKLKRLKLIIEPEPGNDQEVQGILNPAAVRGRDGQLYLFPRIVAKGNYSRIAVARVIFDAAGDPSGIERLGIALEPETDYELRPDGSGGCEDPRVTYVEPLGHYTMTYVALTPRGPRIALAISEDLIHWERLGLATFEPYHGMEFDGIDNKDGGVYPTAVPDPDGEPALAILHRPLFPGTRPEQKARRAEDEPVDLQKESIWISYRDMTIKDRSPNRLSHFSLHHRLAAPAAAWERLKIGTGTPPILTRHGWLIVYHGVGKTLKAGDGGRKMSYSAGIMVLAKDDPQHILYRTPQPVLRPELPEECHGAVANLVFPTGIDRRDDLGNPDRLDIYYGMADDRIGVARLDLPEELPR